jgi:hypothetical protein
MVILELGRKEKENNRDSVSYIVVDGEQED